MIISHKHRIVFFHNPKVAGSAIRKALQPIHDDPMDYWHQGYVKQLDRVADLAHLTVHDFQTVHPSLKTGAYQFFVVIRNPYQRFVSSLAEHVRQHQEMIYDDAEDWVRRYMDETNFRFNWKYIHFCPQHYFVPDTDRFRVTIARHETLNADWERWVNVNFGHNPIYDLSLPKVRVRPDIDALTVGQLSPYVIQQINRVYHEDFERFGFEKMLRTADGDTHYERVNSIHSPYMVLPKPTDLTEGELKAYHFVHGVE